MIARSLRSIAAIAASLVVAGCGGLNTPEGSVVNSPGGSGPPPTHLVDVRVTVTLPLDKAKIKPQFLSPGTKSLVVQLVSVDGQSVTGVNPTTINTVSGARDCKSQGKSLSCVATIKGSPGKDRFAVTAYADVDATGDVLCVGTVGATVSSGGGFGISNRLSLTLDGVVAAMSLAVVPEGGKRGEHMVAAVNLNAYDASGAQIVGPAEFDQPISLSIQGDSAKAFALHLGSRSASSLTITKPASDLSLTYDGNAQADSISLQASAGGGPSSIGAHAAFDLRGKQPPPPVGTIYVLNLGAKDGQGATVTEYDGKARGNAAPERTLDLDTKLFARTIALDASGNLYVGYLDNDLGFSIEDGRPDAKNEIAVYAPGASGNQSPSAVLAADKTTQTTLFPINIAFDPSGRLVTFGATGVGGNAGNDAVLTYVAGSSGPSAPIDGWNFETPEVYYAGPTGLALDAKGNFYVNGAFHTALEPSYGLYVAAASDIGNPTANPARVIPWDSKTELSVGLTTNVSLSDSGEIVIGNDVTQGSGSNRSCQARANVFAAGASGGTTDVSPLRVLTLGGAETHESNCNSSRNPLTSYFPTIVLYGNELFVADDFNNAVDAYSAGGKGVVNPSTTISGSATQLDAPIALAITKLSGQAKAGPAIPFHALPR